MSGTIIVMKYHINAALVCYTIKKLVLYIERIYILDIDFVISKSSRITNKQFNRKSEHIKNDKKGMVAVHDSEYKIQARV